MIENDESKNNVKDVQEHIISKKLIKLQKFFKNKQKHTNYSHSQKNEEV